MGGGGVFRVTILWLCFKLVVIMSIGHNRDTSVIYKKVTFGCFIHMLPQKGEIHTFSNKHETGLVIRQKWNINNKKDPQKRTALERSLEGLNNCYQTTLNFNVDQDT